MQHNPNPMIFFNRQNNPTCSDVKIALAQQDVKIALAQLTPFLCRAALVCAYSPDQSLCAIPHLARRNDDDERSRRLPRPYPQPNSKRRRRC